jgi:hypothetical protein
MAYAANTSVNTTMHRVPPGRHVFVARDPSASAGDESSLRSVDALPPATSHGYAEWDFSGVPDPVMFRRFLDAADYWFGYSDDSMLTMKIRQPSHEFTFGVGMTFVSYPLVLTPVV